MTPQELSEDAARRPSRAAGYVRALSGAQQDDVVDPSWDPPVTRGVRLVSRVDDAAQHLGQAAHVRGLLDEDWSGPY